MGILFYLILLGLGSFVFIEGVEPAVLNLGMSEELREKLRKITNSLGVSANSYCKNLIFRDVQKNYPILVQQKESELKEIELDNKIEKALDENDKLIEKKAREGSE